MKQLYPEKHYYPFLTKRNGNIKEHKWFPIGWAVNIHSLGNGTDPNVRPEEWINGNIQYLIDDGCWWVNCIYPLAHSNMEAWGYPKYRPQNQWTTTQRYINLLDFLELKYNETNGKVNIKALPCFVHKFDDNLEFYLMGDWEGIPGRQIEVLIERINAIKDKKQLGGWMLVDEPYGGDTARIKGVRNEVYERIKFIKEIIERNDDKINDHPFWIILRGYGNYALDPCKNPDWVHLLNQLIDCSDYICDNLYLGDFLNDGNNGNGEFITRTKTRVEQARKCLLERVCNTPNLGSVKKAFLMYSQGMHSSPAIHPINGDSYLDEEDLRYQNYCSWINGAMGCMFWQLSKSDEKAYAMSKKISYEAYRVSEFLLNEPDDKLDEFKLEADNEDCQFILRRNPHDKNELLVMMCNNSEKMCYVTFYGNSNIKITDSRPLINGYNWYNYRMGNSFRFTVPKRFARAYLIKTEDRN